MSQSIRDYFESIIAYTDEEPVSLDDAENTLMHIRQTALSALQQMDKPARKPMQQQALNLN